MIIVLACFAAALVVKHLWVLLTLRQTLRDVEEWHHKQWLIEQLSKNRKNSGGVQQEIDSLALLWNTHSRYDH